MSKRRWLCRAAITRPELLESRRLLAADLSLSGAGADRGYSIDPAEFRESWSPVSVALDSSMLAHATAAVFKPMIVGGIDERFPSMLPDSPPSRVDPNTPGGRPFGGVGSIRVEHELGNFICSGVVIHERFVLTAAHCFDLEANPDGMVDPEFERATFILNDGGDETSSHVATRIHIHPDFGGFSTAGANDDLAIMELSVPVPAGTPVYGLRSGEMTIAEQLQLVGYGRAGFGDQGFTVLPAYDVKRFGKNAADLFAVDDEGSGVDEVYLFDFDEPTSTDSGFLGGFTLGNDIEATLGGGDSGGPAFVTVGDELVVAGINTFEFVLEGTTPPPGFFGSLGGGIIIGPYVPWVTSIVPLEVDQPARSESIDEPIIMDIDYDTPSPPPQPAVLLGGSSWAVDPYSLLDLGATEDSLPWINLDQIQLRYEAPHTPASISLEGPVAGSFVPTTLLDFDDSTATHSFPILADGYYRLVIDQEATIPAIDFTVLHSNLTRGPGPDAVDFADFVELSRQFDRPLETTASRSDLDGDGRVVFLDFVRLIRDFGNQLSAGPVPSAMPARNAALDLVFMLQDEDDDEDSVARG